MSGDGDASVSYSQTFANACYVVNAFMYDGTSTFDGSGIADASTALNVTGGAGNDDFTGGAGDNSFWAGDADNQLIAGPGAVNDITAGNGPNYVVAGPAMNDIILGNFNNTVVLAGNTGIEGEDFLELGAGNNLIDVDEAITNAWSVTAGGGDNEFVLTDSTSPATVMPGAPTYFDFASGGFVEYYSSAAGLVDYQELGAGLANNLALDNGGDDQGLPVPTDTIVTVTNGTDVNLLSRSVAVAGMDVVDGSVYNGTVGAAEFTVVYATIGANLSGGTLTLSGNGYATLTGNNSLAATVIGATANDTGTLAMNAAAALGAGTITFVGPGTVQALGDLTFSTSQAIVTPGGAGATVDANGYNVQINSPVSGSGGLTIVDTSGGYGTVELAGSNSYSGVTEVAVWILVFANTGSLPSTAASSILVDAGVGLEAAGPWTTVMGWLGSGVIDPSSAGAILLTADSTETIDMSGYPALSLGAAANVAYSGNLTPADFAYQLGGGPGTLAMDAVLADFGGTPTAVNVNGNVSLQNTSNSYSAGTNLNSGITAAGADPVFGSPDGPLNFVNRATIQALASFTLASTREISTPDGSDESAVFDSNGYALAIDSPISAGGVTFIDSSTGGAGIVGLYAANTFSGPTDIESGTVQVNNASAIGTGALIVNEGTFDLNGYSITVPSLSGGGGTITNNGAGTSATLTVDQGSDTTGYIYAGSIQDGLGTVAVATAGAGSLTFAGTNTNSGGTFVTSVLIVSSASGLADGSNLTVGDASAFSGGIPGDDFARGGSYGDSDTSDTGSSPGAPGLSANSPLAEIEQAGIDVLNVIADTFDATHAQSAADMLSALTTEFNIINASMDLNGGERTTSAEIIATATTQELEAAGMSVTAATCTSNYVQAEAAADIANIATFTYQTPAIQDDVTMLQFFVTYTISPGG